MCDRKSIVIIVFLPLALLWATASLAASVKLKHAQTVYQDETGLVMQGPSGVAVADGMLWVADSVGRRIFSYRLDAGGLKPAASFSLPDMSPLMAQPTRDGSLYVLDGRARDIFIVEKTGEVKGKLAPTGLPDGRRIVPRSIKSGTNGDLMVLDIFSERVIFFDAAGAFIRQAGFPEDYGAISDMAVDVAGNVYLLDSVRAVIYKAPGNNGFEPLDTIRDVVDFPASIDCDIHGRLFVADRNGSGLAVIGADGRFAGRALAMGWEEGLLRYPRQLSVAGDVLFVADTENRRVQRFQIVQ